MQRLQDLCIWLLLLEFASLGSSRQTRVPELLMQDSVAEGRFDTNVVTYVVLPRLLLALSSSVAHRHLALQTHVGNFIQSPRLPVQLDWRIPKRSVARYRSAQMKTFQSLGGDVEIVIGAFVFLVVGYFLSEVLYTSSADSEFQVSRPNFTQPMSVDDMISTADKFGFYSDLKRPTGAREALSIHARQSFFDFLSWYELIEKVKASNGERYINFRRGAESTDLFFSFTEWLSDKTTAQEVAAGPDTCSLSFVGLPVKQLSVADSNVPLRIAQACQQPLEEGFGLLITVRSDKSSQPLGWLEASVARLPPPAYISLPWYDPRLTPFKNKNDPKGGMLLSNILVIQILGVDPSFLRRGVAKKLLDWILRKAQCWRADGVALICNEKNFPALRLYRSLGFDTVPNWLGDVSDHVLMVKWF